VRKNPRLVAAIVWTVLMFCAHSIPKSKLQEIPGGEYVHKEGPDKIGHAVMFLVLGVLWYRAFPSRPGTIVLAGIGYGALLELYQDRLVAGRTGSVTDVVADAVGMTLAIVLLASYHRAAMRQSASGRSDLEDEQVALDADSR
jgi:hypothetical protein